MSKITLFIGAVGIALLVITGVIRVEIQPERLSAVPGTVSSLIADTNVLATVRNQAISWKRKGELYLADSAQKKIDLAMKYTETDSKRLQDALDSDAEPEVLIPNAELLATSIEQMKEYAAELSEEDLVTVQERSKQIAQTTGETLQTLKEVQEGYAQFEERLANVTDTLEAYLGFSEVTIEGDVAGAQDTTEDKGVSIPLRF